MKGIAEFLKEHAYGIAAPLLLLMLFTFFLELPALQQFENLTVDWRFSTREADETDESPEILLVAIDQQSIDRFKSWPWSRSVHGNFLFLMSELADRNEAPAVIGYDVLFVDKSEERVDKFLTDGATEFGDVIFGAFAVDAEVRNERDGELAMGMTKIIQNVDGDVFNVPGSADKDTVLVPLPLLRFHAEYGFTDTAPASSDKVRRTMPMVNRVEEDIYPSFVTQIYSVHKGVQREDIEVRLGEYMIFPTLGDVLKVPINSRGEMRINYKSGLEFEVVSFEKLAQTAYDYLQGGKEWPEDVPKVAGRIVVVGATIDGIASLAQTPLDSETPPVYTHLYALNNLLKSDFIKTVPAFYEGLGFLVICWATLIGLRKKNMFLTFGVPIAFILLFVLTVFSVFYSYSLQLQMFWPVIGFSILHLGSFIIHWAEEFNSKQEIKSVFSSYIAPAVMDQLLEDPDNIRLGGTRKPVTVLFSDIRSFTSISESIGEEVLVRQLNEYFEEMVGCVNDYKGTLHKYIGDAIMAVWGDVVSKDVGEDALNAVRASVAMRQKLVMLNQRWEAEGRQVLKIGIGLNHGPVVVGNIGATQRMEFTVIGDAVNLASRLEGVTKQFRTDMVIGENVREFSQHEFLTRSVGNLVVKGKTKPVRVFEVCDKLDAADSSWDKDWVYQYEEAFECFCDRQFEKAVTLFEDCLEKRPGDFCSEQYREASRGFIETAPPDDWNGVLVLTSK